MIKKILMRLTNSPQFDCNMKKQIKIALIDRGISQKQLATELGVAQATISQVISGKMTSARVREYILNRLGLASKRRRAK